MSYNGSLSQRFLKTFNIIRMLATHSDKTKDVVRDKLYSTAIVKKIFHISPTVKQLNLFVEKKDFSFKPGQWVDFYAPTLSTVGGYSMCSNPSLLEKEQMLNLAVKYSDRQPAYWVHTECKEGDRVGLQVGGSFSYSVSKENAADHILLVAAGVGINPLFSMLLQIAEAYSSLNARGNAFGKLSLLYTATNQEELIFKADIDDIVSRSEAIDCRYFVTRELNEVVDDGIFKRRMDKPDFLHVLNRFETDPSNVICFLCGPETMMLSVKETLVDLGLKPENVRYESWW